MPQLRPWMIDTMGIKIEEISEAAEKIDLDKIPKPIMNEDFMQELSKTNMEVSIDPMDR